jgi:putative hemolysin
MLITLIWVAVLVLLVTASSVASYLRLHLRRLTPVAERRLFQSEEDRRPGADRERVGVSISVLHGAAMALFAVGLTGFFFVRRPGHLWENLGGSLLIVLSVIAVCDQLIPFRLVARHDEPEVILQAWMPYLRLSVFLALPLTFPIMISTTIARLLDPPASKPQELSAQEDLQELIEAGEQEGLIEEGEGELLHSVVEFGDKVVREVMTPRPDIAALEINASVEDLRRLLREKRHTRYPIYSGQLDRVEGIVSVRDVMELPPDELTKVTLGSLVRRVPFVPETKPVKDLLRELQQTTTQLAIVIDEYGSVAGLVTIEDLVEEIIGKIRDEVEPHAHDIVKESANSYLVAGHAELSQIAGQFHVALEGQDYSTVAGLLLAELGHVPSPGEKIDKSGVTFEVLEANQRTVLKVRLRFSAPTSQSAPAHAGPQSN